MIPSGLLHLATIQALLRNVQSVMPSRLLLAVCVRARRLVAVSALWLCLPLSANDRTSVGCRHHVQSRWLAGSAQRPLPGPGPGLLRHPRTWPSPALLSRRYPPSAFSSALPPSLAWARGPSAQVSAGRAVCLTVTNPPCRAVLQRPLNWSRLWQAGRRFLR